MKELKMMLLGIAIMLLVIVFHLLMEDGLLTDLIALIGFALVIIGYVAKNGKDPTAE